MKVRTEVNARAEQESRGTYVNGAGGLDGAVSVYTDDVEHDVSAA
jgi:hypothetical protein